MSKSIKTPLRGRLEAVGNEANYCCTHFPIQEVRANSALCSGQPSLHSQLCTSDKARGKAGSAVGTTQHLLGKDFLCLHRSHHQFMVRERHQFCLQNSYFFGFYFDP